VKRGLTWTAALVAAVGVLAGVSLPPARLELPSAPPGTVAGIIHVHTNRSDGRLSPGEVAAAAARAGIQFVVFTDHGDGTAPPDPPMYRAGVLCLDGVEISTSGGHYLALGMPAAPYPLGGDARGVVEDVRRLGGFGVIAHPDSPRPELRWQDWDLPFDGVEVINPDTSWRVYVAQSGWRPKVRLLQALSTYPFRGPETLAALMATTSSSTVAEFGAIAARRPVVALAGADAHESLGIGSADPGTRRAALPFPAYETVFSSLAMMVRVERPLSGDAAGDAELVMDAIRGGRLHAVVSGMARPAVFAFTAENDRGSSREGGSIPAGGPVTLRVRSNAPPGFVTTVYEGTRLLSSGGSDLDVVAGQGPGVYRAEIRAANQAGGPPWLVSNPIYVTAARTADEQTPPLPSTDIEAPLFDGRSGSGWRVETDPTSRADFELVSLEDAPVLRFRYALSGGRSVGQFAALAVETPGGVAPHDRIIFTAGADQPMRVSVKARVANDGVDEHWERSVYLDQRERELTVSFSDMTPAGATRTAAPPAEAVHSIVLVVELIHAKPGSSGRFWVRKAALAGRVASATRS
jgi:hypothetical protein